MRRSKRRYYSNNNDSTQQSSDSKSISEGNIATASQTLVSFIDSLKTYFTDLQCNQKYASNAFKHIIDDEHLLLFLNGNLEFLTKSILLRIYHRFIELKKTEVNYTFLDKLKYSMSNKDKIQSLWKRHNIVFSSFAIQFKNLSSSSSSPLNKVIEDRQTTNPNLVLIGNDPTSKKEDNRKRVALVDSNYTFQESLDIDMKYSISVMNQSNMNVRHFALSMFSKKLEVFITNDPTFIEDNKTLFLFTMNVHLFQFSYDDYSLVLRASLNHYNTMKLDEKNIIAYKIDMYDYHNNQINLKMKFINSENKLDFNWYLVKLLLEGQKFKIKSQIQLDF